LLKYLIISIRPKQWYKNSLLFIGIVFSANLLDASMWGTVVLAFIYFCMLSSAEYLINDICDRESDRIHPLKSQRPIASGQIKVPYALLFALLLVGFALLGAYFTINLNFLIISASYLLLILLYSLVAKRLIIVDVLVISTGFVIRAVAGAVAIDVVFTPWLIACSLLLALFLALEKRWHEHTTLAENAAAHRSSLSGYSPKMLEQMIGITTGALIVSYLPYTFFAHGDAMPLTAPFAIYGLFRYIYLVHRKRLGGEPEVIFKDKAMLINLGIWGLLVVSIMLYEAL
jgi:4-hydroxybenzoate polyprenyltransferase